MSQLTAQLAAGEPILIDGATGTELEVYGVPMVDDAWCALASHTHPEAVKAVHRTNIEAGAQLIIANTFVSSRHVLERAGLGSQFEELNRVSVELALQARDATADELGQPPVAVAGSISTTAQGGEKPPLDVSRANFADQVQIQADAGVDLFILEMMRDIDQTNVILDAIQTTGLPVWVGYSCEVIDNEPQLLYGACTLADAVDSLDGRNLELLALMHTEVDHIDRSLDVLQERWKGPIGVYAHTGLWEQPNWVFSNTISPADYSHACERWLDRGVQVVGGCCGIRPDHIRALNELLRTRQTVGSSID